MNKMLGELCLEREAQAILSPPASASLNFMKLLQST